MGHPMSLADWNRALAAPKSELPTLDDGQKKAARKFGETLEEYARRELAGRYGQERVRHRAGLLGEVVASILKGVAPNYRLIKVIADMFKERWIFTVQAPKGLTNVAIERDLGDDVVDWSLREGTEEITGKLLYGLGLDKMTVK